MVEQVAILGQELLLARGQVSDVIAEREKAAQRLQQEINATAALQRELAGLRQTEALAALVNRLATVKHMFPGPVKRYIKNRLIGRRP
jgi:hypothetical protein